MARDPDDRAVRVATLALMAVAYATCEVAAYPDGRPRPSGVGFGVVAFVLAVLAAATLRPASAAARPSGRLSAALGLVLALPVLVEPAVRSWAGAGFPLELQLVNGLRVLGLSLAGLAAWPRLRRLAGVVALFLALFASAMGDQPAIPYLLAAFALAGGLWLVLEHRSAGGGDAAVAAGELRERVPLRLPYREAVVFGVLAAAAGAVAVAGPKRVVLSLGELVPTSGGTGETDPFARYGVGDGPEEVAGDDARAAGMVETDKMIEDNRNALIDAVNDQYGPPHNPPKPPKERERMVAGGVVKVIESHGRLPENRRPSRDFDTARQGPKAGRPPDSQAARGVFEVKGRTPVHVRLVAYDTYDPAAGRWVEGRRPSGRVLEAEGDDWMAVGNLRAAAWYSADDRHRLAVADLKDNLVPTPAHLTRFRIRKVDRPDYYQWEYEGVLALAGRKRTPPGVVVTTVCRTLDPARLGEAAFAAGGVPPALVGVPAADREGLGRIAAEWAGDRPRGWPQVDAVLSRLRADYALDRAAVPPAGHPAPVRWFLTESRRGPDYQFATAAALLLRSLGYPARVCLGYYASPAAYDPETDHTPVKTTDLHVWPEVLLRDGHWLVVEPTPGYTVLPPLQTWGEWAADRAAAAAAFGRRNAGPLAVLAGLAAALGWRWRAVWDAAVTARWVLFPGRTWGEAALGAARVLDRRGALAGRGRRASQSLTDWAAGLAADEPLARLVRLAEQAAYAPALPPPVAEAEVLPLCRRAVRGWPYRKFVSAPPGGLA
jgi:transglutaminase-like putative cysteine protease